MDPGAESTSEDEMSIYVDETVPIGELSLPFPPRDVTVRRNTEVRKIYNIGEEVGRGKFGIVYRCEDPETRLRLAVKFVATPRKDDKRDVEREVDIMNYLQHPGIIQIYDAFDGGKEMALVMELVEGGELFDRVIEDDYVLTERACAIFIRQVCAGVNFMHTKHVLHLDMKPENILCLSKTGNRIKIIDFGLARRYDPSKKLQVLFGTPEFVAPEVVNFDAIGYATDMWSVGVIAYVLVSGLSPFMGDTDVETMANVTIAKYDFDDEAFDDVSDACKEFIAAILIKDKKKRMTSDQALEHRWLNMTKSPVPSRLARSRTASIPSEKSLDTAQVNLMQFVERWVSHPDSPYAFSDSSAEIVLSRVGSAESVGFCSRSACESVSSPAESSADSNTDEDEEAICRSLMLPPGVGPEKPKPAEHIRVSSIRREDSLKRVRGRLVHQASKEEHYLSIDQVKTLKQQGSIDDMVQKVSSRPDSRRCSVTQPPLPLRLRADDTGSKRHSPSPLMSATPGNHRAKSPGLQVTVCDRVMQEAAAALAEVGSNQRRSVSPLAGSTSPLLNSASPSKVSAKPKQTDSASPKKLSGASSPSANKKQDDKPSSISTLRRQDSVDKPFSSTGDGSKLSVQARSRTPSVTVTSTEANSCEATKKSGSVSPSPSKLSPVPGRKTPQEPLEEPRKSKSLSPRLGASPTLSPALSIDGEDTEKAKRRSKSPSVPKDSADKSDKPRRRSKASAGSEPADESSSSKPRRSRSPPLANESPGPPQTTSSPTVSLKVAGNEKPVGRVIHHTIVPEPSSPTPSSPTPKPNDSAAKKPKSPTSNQPENINSMIMGLKPVKRSAPAPAASVSPKSSGLVLPQLRKVPASKSDATISPMKSTGEVAQVKLKHAKPSAPNLTVNEKPAAKEKSQTGSTTKKKTLKSKPSIDGDASPTNGESSKKRQSKNGHRPREHVIHIEVLSCAGQERAESGLRRLRRALRTLSTGSNSAPSSPYGSRGGSPEPGSGLRRGGSPQRLIKSWHRQRLQRGAAAGGGGGGAGGGCSWRGPTLLAFVAAQLEEAAARFRQERELFRSLLQQGDPLPAAAQHRRPAAGPLLWAKMGCSIPD